jgi:hypothetical protein
MGGLLEWSEQGARKARTERRCNEIAWGEEAMKSITNYGGGGIDVLKRAGGYQAGETRFRSVGNRRRGESIK